MEISSNATSGVRVTANRSQFTFSSDLQQKTTFDLLLSLPVSFSTEVESDIADRPIAAEDTPDNSTHQASDSPDEDQQEPHSSDESEFSINQASPVIVAAQQIQPVQEPAAEQIEAKRPDDHLQIDTANPDSVSGDPQIKNASADASQNATAQIKPDSQQPILTSLNEAKPVSDRSELINETLSSDEAAASQSVLQQIADKTLKLQSIPVDQGEQGVGKGTLVKNATETVDKPQQTFVSQAEESKVQLPQAELPQAELSTAELSNAEKAAESETQADSSRRGQHRDRPARWYEQDSNNTQTGLEKVDGMQSENNQDTPLIPDRDAAAGDQITDSLPPLQTNNDAAIEDALTPIASSAVIDLTNNSQTVGTMLPKTAAVELQPGSLGEANRATTLASEATGSRKIPSPNGKPNDSVQMGPQVNLAQAEKAKLVQRITRSFSRIGASGGTMQVRLHPPELGALAIHLRIEGKDMTARLTTESHAAREVILESLPQLRSRLAEQGFDVVQFSVDVAGDSSSLGNQQGTGQGNSGESSQQGSSSSNSTRQNSPVDLRRAAYLRRQLDSAGIPSRSPVGNRVGAGIDIQA